MKVVLYRNFGGTNVLEMAEIPEPVINSKEVLVKVNAVSLNALDWKFRKGQMKLLSGRKFPQYVGGEFSGIIEKVGNEVTAFKSGDEVFGFIDRKKIGGALQEKISVHASLISNKSPNISFEQAACLPIVGIAAYKGLHEVAQIKKGQHILINGCTGNIGIWAVQLCKKEGLHVTGVCHPSGFEFAKSIGCDYLIDYTTQSLEQHPILYDIIFDTASVLSYNKIKYKLNNKGIFLNPTPGLSQILSSFINNIFSSKKQALVLGSPNKAYLKILSDTLDDYSFNIPINKVFEFSEFKSAYDYAEKGGIIGKIVIRI